ncbi:MAG: DsbA family protein [Pseudomonadota bacterium]
MNRNISLVVGAFVALVAAGVGVWYWAAPLPAPPTPLAAPPVQVAQSPATRPAIDAKALAPRQEGEDMVIGLAGAPITVVEYASLTCPHCATFHATTLPRLIDAYVDKGLVKFIYRDFPLDRIALVAAMLARCAGPERYFGFLDVFYRQQANWTRGNEPGQILAALRGLARLGGMSDERIDACLKDQDVQNAVLQQSLKGEKEFEVRSTPTLIINGRKHAGGTSFEDLDRTLRPLAGGS